MGLIMLILIGTVPAAYALNQAVSPMEVQSFVAASENAGQILDRHIDGRGEVGSDPREQVTTFIRTQQMRPETVLAVKNLVTEINSGLGPSRDFKSIPAQERNNVRNDMYLTNEALRLMVKANNPSFTSSEIAALKIYQSKLDRATKFIPAWVKVAVALALGLGTMVGWKRIVVTVGERIGKQHLSYAQGASAELVAMVTIFLADKFGLPVSTTHILSSGVAGTMSANGNGLHLSTVRNIAAGWVFTLPAAALLSGLLYAVFRAIA
jgi:PiT family inorganic phosphate transporter